MMYEHITSQVLREAPLTLMILDEAQSYLLTSFINTSILLTDCSELPDLNKDCAWKMVLRIHLLSMPFILVIDELTTA